MAKENKIELWTFFPFSENHCNNTETIKVINEFSDGKWKSETFYPNKISNFHGCTIRLGVPPAYPGTNKRELKNGTIEFYGSDIKIISELSKKLNFNLKIFSEPRWGDFYENGSSTALINAVYKRAYDLAAGWFFISSRKAKNLDFAQPYFFVPIVVIVPPGAPYSSLENLIRSFSPLLWVGFFTSTLIFILSIIFTDKSPQKIRKYFYDKNEKFDYNMIFIIIIGDGSSNLPRKSSTRLIVMSFILFCFVLRSAYTSEMFNFLQSGANQPSIDSLEDLNKRGYTFNVPDYFEFYISLKEIKVNPR
jgi:ABC-type amino acid transport substrate-binding protein